MLKKSVQSVYIDDIGNVQFKRNSLARYLKIRVSSNEGVVVTIPSGISESMALRFVHAKKEWILKSVEKQSKLRQKTIFSESVPFRTRMHTLIIMQHDKNTLKSLVSGDKIAIWYPQSARVEERKIQAFIRRAVIEALRVEAKQHLPGRTAALARQFNFNYHNLTIKNTKTRWGSCSAKNNINLNLQLMRLPDHLIDYVILHELTHTKEKNHQKTFWLKLESILPGARKIDKELNKYHLETW